jgi:hypothetical protein
MTRPKLKKWNKLYFVSPTHSTVKGSFGLIWSNLSLKSILKFKEQLAREQPSPILNTEMIPTITYCINQKSRKTTCLCSYLMKLHTKLIYKQTIPCPIRIIPKVKVTRTNHVIFNANKLLNILPKKIIFRCINWCTIKNWNLTTVAIFT